MIKNVLAAALIVGASAAASAQTTSDTTHQQRRSQTEQQQPSNQFNSRDYTQIQSTDVPASLRTTLQGDTYRGWEQGKLYRRNSGDGYYLSTGSGSNAKNYYFDKNGKAIQGQGSQSTSGSESDRPATGAGSQPSGGSQPEKP